MLWVILDYIRVFLSWPSVTLICFLLFFCSFRNEIRELLNRIKKIYGLELSQKPQDGNSEGIKEMVKAELEKEWWMILTKEEVDNIREEYQNLELKTTEQNTQIEDKDLLIKYLMERSEIYEFAYLNGFLVMNTKLWLRWFYNLGGLTKEYFKVSFSLSAEILNHEVEKEAIFNALLVNELINKESWQEVFKVTLKWERFLKYIKMI